jgi:hypothetical protein
MRALKIFRCHAMRLPVSFRPTLAALLVVSPVLAWAQGAAPKAGDQAAIVRDIADAGGVRLQGQRIAKLYLQSGLGLNAAAATRQIGQAVAQTDGELKRLERHGKKAAIQRTLARCQATWQELRAAIGQPYGPAAAERVSRLAEELAIHAGKLALQIEAEAETPAGRLVDGSARLNMLAQRLARLYMQAQAGDRSQGLLVDLEQTRKEFAAGLSELERAPENTPASREVLGLASTQWIFFDGAVRQIQGKGTDGKAPLNVATTSERIQETLAAVTAQYAQDSGAAGRPVR